MNSIENESPISSPTRNEQKPLREVSPKPESNPLRIITNDRRINSKDSTKAIHFKASPVSSLPQEENKKLATSPAQREIKIRAASPVWVEQPTIIAPSTKKGTSPAVSPKVDATQPTALSQQEEQVDLELQAKLLETRKEKENIEQKLKHARQQKDGLRKRLKESRTKILKLKEAVSKLPDEATLTALRERTQELKAEIQDNEDILEEFAELMKDMANEPSLDDEIDYLMNAIPEKMFRIDELKKKHEQLK